MRGAKWLNAAAGGNSNEENPMKLLMMMPILLLSLTACLTTERPAISGSPDSGVRLVEVGMSPERVTGIIGNFQSEQFDASDGSTSCRSYIYDETIGAKYVHVYFYNQRVTSASDGHKGLCLFGGDTFTESSRLTSLIQNPNDLRAFLSNTTLRSWDSFHGTDFSLHHLRKVSANMRRSGTWLP